MISSFRSSLTLQQLNPMKSIAWISALLTASNTNTAQHVLKHPEPSSSPPRPFLNFSSSSPLIFHSTFALLQQWSNTFFPNGHSITTGIIPRNTNLYHARSDSALPPSPEWFALDAEMSYWISGMMPGSHMLTFRTTRDVQVLYFDGTSAALVDDGSMDSQMTFIYNSSSSIPGPPRFGRPPPRGGDGPPYEPPPGHGSYGNGTRWNPIQAEYDRADRLCTFIRERGLGGLGWGFEGIVRMNAAFEVIWCNFTSPSAKLISWINVTVPLFDVSDEDGWVDVTDLNDEYGKPDDPGRPPRKGAAYRRPRWGLMGKRLPFQRSGTWDWFNVAANRYGFVGGSPGRGESRVTLDSCTLFSFYDPHLHDQDRARVQQEQRLFNLTSDGTWMAPANATDKQEAATKLSRRRRTQRATNVSEIDGVFMRRTIETRMRAVLDPSDKSCSGIDWVATCQEIVIMYAPLLHQLSTMLSKNIGNSDDERLRAWVARFRQVIHRLYMPYYEYPVYDKSNLDTAFSTSAPLSQKALQRCVTQYEPMDPIHLSPSENTTYTAIHDVLYATCTTLLFVFLATERFWLGSFNNFTTALPPSIYDETQLFVQRNGDSLQELMAWLGWADQWTACSPGCEIRRICYIPIWPVMSFWPWASTPNGTDGGGDKGEPRGLEDYLWEPRCVDDENYPPK